MTMQKKKPNWLKRLFQHHEHDAYFLTDEQCDWQQECADSYITPEEYKVKYDLCETEEDLQAFHGVYLYQAYDGASVNGIRLPIGYYRTKTAMKWIGENPVYRLDRG